MNGILTKPQEREIKFATQFKNIVEFHKYISGKGNIEEEFIDYCLSINVDTESTKEKLFSRFSGSNLIEEYKSNIKYAVLWFNAIWTRV